MRIAQSYQTIEQEEMKLSWPAVALEMCVFLVLHRLVFHVASLSAATALLLFPDLILAKGTPSLRSLLDIPNLAFHAC